MKLKAVKIKGVGGVGGGEKCAGPHADLLLAAGDSCVWGRGGGREGGRGR